MATSSLVHEGVHPSSPPFKLRKASFSADAWVKAMQTPQNRALLASVEIQDGTQTRCLPLADFPLNSFSLKAKNGIPFIVIGGRQYKILSAAKKMGSSLVFNKDGIYAVTPQSEQQVTNRKTSIAPAPATPPVQTDFKKAAATPLRLQEDSDLLQKIMDGDTAAFGTYITRHKNRFIKKMSYHGLSLETAEDVLQDVQLKFIEFVAEGKWHFEGSTNKVEAWIINAIKNREIDKHRSKKRKDAILQEDEVVGVDGEMVSLIDLAADFTHEPSGLLQTYGDIDAYLECWRRIVDNNPTSPVRYALGFAQACLQKDITQQDYAIEVGKTPRDMKTYIGRARTQLEKSGLGPEALREGRFSREPSL